MKKKAWKTFIRLKREDEEDIDQYIDKFEECYADLMKVGRDLDDETLALQLMESAGLKDELSQLVITGIDEEREDIFDQTKWAMRKYLGSERAGISAKGDIKIKEEVFESVNEEALYARTNFYRPIGGCGNVRGGFRGGKSFQRARGTAGRVQVRSYGRGATRGNLAVNSNTNTNDKEVIDKESERKIVKRQVNPLDEYGNPQTCHICGSIFHFAGRDGIGCAESCENLQGMYKDAYKCDVDIDQEEVFMMENSNEALLDSCCTANVMGVDWRDNFFACLSEDDQNEIKFLQPHNRFKFGRENPVHSVEKVEFPCYLFGKKTTLVADVVERDIPLLISKPEMKKRGSVLNFNDDSLEADGIKYNLQTTLSGHFKIPLWYQEEINLCVNEMNEAEQIKTVKKLHRQFRHQSEKVTEDLMRRAEVLTPELK